MPSQASAGDAVARYFDASAKDYDREFSESSVWALAHHTGRLILDAALGDRRHLAVADIGCGTGKWAGYVATRAESLLLSDVSAEMVNAAAAKFGHLAVRTLVASVDRLEALDDESFDLVMCMGDPLSYALDHQRGVGELCRIARPGALIFVSVDSRLGYLRILKERHGCDLPQIIRFLETGDQIGWEGLRIHAFTAGELRTLFARAGCSVVGIHSLPTVSAYFMFEDRFREQLADQDLLARLLDLEHKLLAEGSPGPHHLYAMFTKDGTP